MKIKILSLSVMMAIAGSTNAAQWLRYGGDTSNTHKSDHGPAKDKVSTLKRSTKFEPTSYTNGVNLERATTSQLISKGNSIYYGDYSGAVIKRSEHTGAVRWKTVLPEGGSVRSTPLIDGQFLWVVNYDSTYLYKLNRMTGAIVLSKRLTDFPEGAKIWHQASGSPALAKVNGRKLIIQGLDSGQNLPFLFDETGAVVNNSLGQPAGAFTDQAVKIPGQQHYNAVGQIIAVDADTGDIVWRRPVNANPGEYGIGVWSTAAIDEDAGFGYIGTGQSYNPPASPNACAVLKFDLATGAIVHTYPFQPTPLTRMESCVYSAEYPGGNPAIPTPNDPIGNDRDLAYYDDMAIDGHFYGDNDVGSSPVLYKTKVNGQNVKVVAAISKAGRIRAFNRVTDNMLWERVITTTSGSNFGAPGLAYDNGVVYAASVNDVLANNRRGFAVSNGVGGPLDTIYVIMGPSILNSTQLSALNDANGQSIWAQDPVLTGHTFAAPTISKGVLYHVSFDSTVRAFDTSTGVQMSTAQPLGPTAALFDLPCLPPATCSMFTLHSIPGNSVTFADKSLFIPAGIDAMGPGAPDGGIYKYSINGK